MPGGTDGPQRIGNRFGRRTLMSWSPEEIELQIDVIRDWESRFPNIW